jgi:imidazolonepropionase-like amidohydrolase
MSRLVLRDASLLDGNNPARKATVVVAGERIEAVSDVRVETRPGDRVLELAGRTVMPGMVMSHFHAGYWMTGASGRPVGLETHPSLQAIRAVANVRTALECGFTGAISAGSPHGIDAALKTAIAEGTIPGPRLIAGSRDIGSTGFSADFSFPSYMHVGARGGVNTGDGPDGIRRAVREEIKDGAEIVKLFVTGGHATIGTGMRWELSREEFAAAVDAAHERGVWTRGNIASAEATLLAMDLGVRIIDHGDGLDQRCIERLVETGTFLAPSMLFPKTVMQAMAGQPWADSMKPDWDAMATILPKANAAGVKLLVGDDFGAFTLAHGQYAEEMALYVEEIGIPALDVIRWATRNGAEAMGMGNETGTVEPGKLADLLVIDGDPSADITVLQDRSKLLAILKGGALVKDVLGAV